MVKMKCYDCQIVMEADSSEMMLKHFYNHYMISHHATITGASEEEKKQWMQRYTADWEKASKEQ